MSGAFIDNELQSWLGYLTRQRVRMARHARARDNLISRIFRIYFVDSGCRDRSCQYSLNEILEAFLFRDKKIASKIWIS